MEKEGEEEMHDGMEGRSERDGTSDSQEKRTRFLASHDDGSIGNASDNLEAVSEAASNHSVASSLEELGEAGDQNDNLSDMVSANVSGRGTPNISGRDTPSSQVTEGEECAVGGGAQQGSGGARQQLIDTPSTMPPTKQTRFDIDEKFGKFEIKKLVEGGDETISLVSDTWSTDVLASDSETVEQAPSLPGQQPFNACLLPDLSNTSLVQWKVLDISETASEAWSTDVVASDSERLTEVDTDDTASVARSDDTARSEVESRGEPEGEEVTLPPPLSNWNPFGAGMLPTPQQFRPIGSGSAVQVPLSPTRLSADGGAGSSTSTSSLIAMGQSAGNVTGQGGAKADYRRRTIEYIDSNRRDYKGHGLGRGLLADRSEGKPAGAGTSLNGGSLQSLGPPAAPPPIRPPLTNASITLPAPTSDTAVKLAQFGAQTASSQDVSVDETDVVGVGAGVSSASLASLSSSSSSCESPQDGKVQFERLSSSSTSLLLNGEVAVPEASASSSSVAAATASLAATGSKQGGTGLPTGTIPKSISFDKTAERGDKELLDEDGKSKRSFFRNFKLAFKNRRGSKSYRSGSEDLSRLSFDEEIDGLPTHRARRSLLEDGGTIPIDTSDDILAKYRRKTSGSSSGGACKGDVEEAGEREGGSDEGAEPGHVEAVYAFTDAKRKLRLVLSTAEVQQVPDTLPAMREAWSQKENELVAFLQLQLAEAINLQDRSLIAHLNETLRCVRHFDNQACRKLFESLKEDYKNRSTYVAYLIRCRQSLLSTLAHLERLTERVSCDCSVVTGFLTATCVHLFLERREAKVGDFAAEFQQLTLADEKNFLLDNFLQSLSLDMERDPVWQSGSECQLSLARIAVERAVISRVYVYAMYPNGDGDISRDQVLHEHIKKLAKIITPNHKDLRIPKIFHYECPWPSAQAELVHISAYRTPRDKLNCVLRCTVTLTNLLSLARAPAADDIIPVLIYVLIKANPPALLSTVQYVTSFYGNQMEGEPSYWWTQFCSAITFIKNMEYSLSD